MSIMDNVFRVIPEVIAPKEKPSLTSKLKWTLLILVVFFVLGMIPIYGLSSSAQIGLEHIQYLLASKIGTIISVGIGPIVVASIILQLLVGSKIINMDFSDPAQRARFSSWQKLLAIILSFFEAFIYVKMGLLAPESGRFFLVLLQVAIGSIILLYLDEVVKNYGFGSGISLFIAGGVASTILIRIFNPFTYGAGLSIGHATINFASADGLLWSFFHNMGTSGFLLSFVNNLLPIMFALVIFFIVVYFEGVHVNIPLTVGQRGAMGKYPVKFFYVSNMPVILAAALFANIHLLAQWIAKGTGVFSVIFSFIDKVVNPTRSVVLDVLNQVIGGGSEWGYILSSIGYALLYIVVLTAACVLFGVLWVQMAGQDSGSLANQLNKSGMYLPGFRRDPRVVKGVLDRYIPTITILGSIFVGLMAGFADITGAVGTGMGILLTVDILYRMYEELVREQAPQLLPMLGKFMAR
ncbi:MAG: preprotein translocase subunit SecY [Candidatus Diapherotrites archaeon CG09_land_8_20_14_0_10_32_12]|nr:MAG: preprotein translocase subunit SecY [Candidatus Diapherotrites archaeon CG09_land_8_20_14_0_10_32_12]